MAVASLQIHNDAIELLAGDGGARWDDATANFAWVLLGSGYSQSDADTTYGDISAQEIGDADYAQQAVSTRSIVKSGGQTQFKADPANFGSNVTIEAKWLACVQGTATSLVAGDKVVGVIDLDDTSGTSTVSSTNGDFSVTQPATGWFYIQQS